MAQRIAGRDEWTREATETVAPGIHRLPLPLPGNALRAVNTYAIEDPGGLVMVDAGWDGAEQQQALADRLGELGAGLGDIRRLLVTHAHRDHYGQATWLRRSHRVAVHLGRDERENLEAVTNSRGGFLVDQGIRLRRAGAFALVEELARDPRFQPDPFDWDMPDHWLDGGERILVAGREVVTVATPGHTRGHVSFHDPGARILFAGDHILPHITPSIAFEPNARGPVLSNFLDSLARVRRIDVDLVLPAHGPVFSGLRRRVDELVEHHAHRLDAAEAAVRSGCRTADDVARVLTWTRRERAYADLDLFNRMLAVLETAAHLELLVAQQRLDAVEDEGGARRYRSHPAGDPRPGAP